MTAPVRVRTSALSSVLPDACDLADVPAVSGSRHPATANSTTVTINAASRAGMTSACSRISVASSAATPVQGERARPAARLGAGGRPFRLRPRLRPRRCQFLAHLLVGQLDRVADRRGGWISDACCILPGYGWLPFATVWPHHAR